jgi:hypothetical protein
MAQNEASQQTAARDGAAAAPDTVASAIAEIWCDLLQVDRVGLDDNFLLLGGESLLATQAASRIRGRFGRDVPIRTVLIGTVREVAAEIEGGAAQEAANAASADAAAKS